MRDLLGHFVKPRSIRARCARTPAAGTSGVHPANMPVILRSKLLRRASDEDLAAHYDRVQGDSRKDGQARAQVLHEMERRDALAEGKKAREHAKFSRQLA
jgi:hypothetical protein